MALASILLAAAIAQAPDPAARAILDRLLAEGQVTITHRWTAGADALLILTPVRGSNHPGVCERDVLRITALGAAPEPKTGYEPRAAIRSVEANREYALIALRRDDRAWSGELEAACAEAARNELPFVRAETAWEPWVGGQLIAQLRDELGRNLLSWSCRKRCPSESAARDMLRPDRMTTVGVRLDGCPDEEICLEASFRTADYKGWRVTARARRESPQTRVEFTRVQVSPIPEIPVS